MESKSAIKQEWTISKAPSPVEMRLAADVPSRSMKIRWWLQIYCPPDTLLGDRIDRHQKFFGAISNSLAAPRTLSRISYRPIWDALTIPLSTLPLSIFCARAWPRACRARYSCNLYQNQEKASRIASQAASRISRPTMTKGAKVMASKTVIKRTAESCSEAISKNAFW